MIVVSEFKKAVGWLHRGAIVVSDGFPRRWFLGWLMFSWLVVFPQSAMAGVAGVDNLLDKSMEAGTIRVIVTLRSAASLPDRSAIFGDEYDRLLGLQVSAAQKNLLNDLSAGTIVDSPTLFPFTPQMAMRVTTEGLQELASHEDVLAIEEDLPVPPTLDQSVPHIFPSHETSPYTGLGWSVAILDTGVNKNHTFLSGKVVSEACYSTTDPVNSSSSVCPGGASSSTAEDSGLPCPAGTNGCSHGTHVAGIAAGNGDTFDGVARDADLIAVQIFSQFIDPVCSSVGLSSPCALSWISDQISALQQVYALRNSYDIAAVNMSLGGGYYTSFCDSDSRKLSIDNLKAVGIATVIASGNNGYSNAVNAPSCISSAIAVGATNDLIDERAWFSNNGPQLDLYAPGVDIRSSVPSGGYESWNGTSMATPHVAGAWALVRHKFPTESVDEIEQKFKQTGVPITVNNITRKRVHVNDALAIGVGYQYYPQIPCRIVDTRLGSGALLANTSRDFYVWGDATAMNLQGGQDCGLPAGGVGGVVVNLTSTQSGGTGHLKVYPWGSPRPATSILNYPAGTTIGNATVSSSCYPMCPFDITVYSLRDSHVIIDVLGFFK